MKLLFLYGINCNKDIYTSLLSYMQKEEVVIAAIPHAVSKTAQKIEDLSAWVYHRYRHETFDAIIAHSMGGIIAVQLAAIYSMPIPKIICLDTNFVPANAFYRNLMMPVHLERYRHFLEEMFDKEKPFYHPALRSRLQEDFDYRPYLYKLQQKITVIYGDRGNPHSPTLIDDLNLGEAALRHLELHFLANTCHLPMLEDPKGLAKLLYTLLAQNKEKEVK